MYICEDCGIIVEELQKYKESRPYGEGYVFEEYYEATCHHCQGLLVEAELCPICNTVYINAESEDICSNCIEDNQNYETALVFGQENEENQTLNALWRFAFTQDEIESLLKKEFEKLPTTMQDEILKDYFREYENEFNDFLIKIEKRGKK